MRLFLEVLPGASRHRQAVRERHHRAELTSEKDDEKLKDTSTGASSDSRDVVSPSSGDKTGAPSLRSGHLGKGETEGSPKETFEVRESE